MALIWQGIREAFGLIFGLFRACTDGNTMPILCLVSDPRYRATGYGVLNFFNCCIGAVRSALPSIAGSAAL